MLRRIPAFDAFSYAVTLYALVASDANFAVDVLVSRTDAEAALRAAIGDEPGFGS
jgi:hypothetical protein